MRSLQPRMEGTYSGITGALAKNPLEYCVLAACAAIAWAFTVELNLVVFLTFSRRRSVYFWSLLVCSWGCTLHALGFILKFLVGTSWLVDLVFINIGWIMMVSGQSFVLYSRLNLVVRSKAILNTVLAFIIIDGFAFHTPIFVFIYGANSPHPRWVSNFNTMERIQLVGFSIQESVISSIYIVATVKLLGAVYYTRTRQAMLQLLLINLVCIAMDMILIGLEFSGYYVVEASIKPFIYAVKLKLEFAVYAQLRGFTKANFEDKERQREDTSSTTNLQGPTDFIKNIPKALRKPSVISTPTIHTHPEQILRRKNPMNISREWDSSQIELSVSTIAAALTASGGSGSVDVRGRSPYPSKARPLSKSPPDPSKDTLDEPTPLVSPRITSPEKSRPRIESRSKSGGSRRFFGRDRGDMSREHSETSITLNTFVPRPRRGLSGESIPRMDYTPKTGTRLSGVTRFEG